MKSRPDVEANRALYAVQTIDQCPVGRKLWLEVDGDLVDVTVLSVSEWGDVTVRAGNGVLYDVCLGDAFYTHWFRLK